MERFNSQIYKIFFSLKIYELYNTVNRVARIVGRNGIYFENYEKAVKFV